MPEAAYTLTPIAHIRSEFREKFGIPRQSGLVDALRAQVVFTPPFRNADALRGLEDYSHLWLIWQFSQVVAAGADGENWSPTVRPPRLGGNVRMGVFATRSPYRPNALGLSCVRLVGVLPDTPEGPVLTVAGGRPAGRHADLRYQALPARRGRPPLSRRRVCRARGRPRADRARPRRLPGRPAAAPARRAGRRAAKRPAPRLPARPRARLRPRLCRLHRALHRR